MKRTLVSEGCPQAGSVVAERPGPLRVLLVEDDADTADSLALLLRLWGHEAHVCRTGQEALEAALAHPPDVALIDLMLPGMDGCRLARHLRAHPASQEVVLIALTGFGDEAHRRQGREAGFTCYLVKPSDPNELRGILTTLAEREAR